MRLLIIEDNQLIGQALRRGLKQSYAVDVVQTGQDGILQAGSTDYDLMLLDLDLPDMNGQEVCRRLRDKGVTAPILIVTGSAVFEDKIKLLDSGADDYITKPFSLEEVNARIRAALRRPASQAVSALLVAGDLELNPAARTVRRQDQTLNLRRKEFDILEYLMRSRGKTVTRSMIVEHIWDMNENLWANVVDVHIKNLRDKVDRPFHSHLIKTVHGVGYKLEATESK